MSLFLVEAKDFKFVEENESRETKYKVDTQSMRLFGLRNDCAEDVHRADANRLEKISKGRNKMHEGKNVKGDNGLFGLIIGTQRAKEENKGHGENKSAASAQGEHRMHEGEKKVKGELIDY